MIAVAVYERCAHLLEVIGQSRAEMIMAPCRGNMCCCRHIHRPHNSTMEAENEGKFRDIVRDIVAPLNSIA